MQLPIIIFVVVFQCREFSSFLNNDNNDILPVCLWLSVVYRHRQDLLSFTRLFNCCFLLTEKQHSTHLSIWVSRNNQMTDQLIRHWVFFGPRKGQNWVEIYLCIPLVMGLPIDATFWGISVTYGVNSIFLY